MADHNNTPRDHIEYVEICKTIKKKAREDIRKHNLGEIRESPTTFNFHGSCGVFQSVEK